MGGKGAEAGMPGKGLHQPWAGCHSRLRQALQQAEVHTAGHSLFLMLRINTREKSSVLVLWGWSLDAVRGTRVLPSSPHLRCVVASPIHLGF